MQANSLEAAPTYRKESQREEIRELGYEGPRLEEILQPIQNPATFWNRFLMLTHLQLVYHYFFHGMKQTLYIYNLHYETMVSSNRLWVRILEAYKNKITQEKKKNPIAIKLRGRDSRSNARDSAFDPHHDAVGSSKEIIRETDLQIDSNHKPRSSSGIEHKHSLAAQHAGQDKDVVNSWLKLFRMIILMEKWPLIIVFLLSILIGAVSVVAPIFQVLLVDSIFQTNDGNDWTYFGIISASLVVKFFLFNYAQRMSTNIAINVRIYLQNNYVRGVLTFYPEASQTLRSVYFSEIPNIKEMFLFIPYVLTSIVMIIGVLAAILAQTGVFGLIVVGPFLFATALQAVFTVFYYLNANKREDLCDRRTSLTSFAYAELLQMHFMYFKRAFMEKVMGLRETELKTIRRNSLLYFTIQFLSEAPIIISLIILFYIAYDNVGTSFFTVKLAYFVALYLWAIYMPSKMMVYGVYRFVQGFQSISEVRNLFCDPIHHIQDVRVSKIGYHQDQPQDFSYQMIQDLGCKFSNGGDQERVAQVRAFFNKKKAEAVLPFIDPSQNVKGKVWLVTGRMDSQPSLYDYSLDLLQKLEKRYPKDKIAIVGSRPFLVNLTVKENILMGLPYDEAKYNEVLHFTDLTEAIFNLPKIGETIVSEQTFRSHQLLSRRIEFARAIYNDVDFLLVRQGCFINQIQLIEKICRRFRREGKTCFILTSSPYYTDVADHVICIGQDFEFEKGKGKQLFENARSLLHKIFEPDQTNQSEKNKYMRAQSLDKHVIIESFDGIDPPPQAPLHFDKWIFMDFFNQAHFGAFFLIFLALVIPILLRIYLTILIGQSLNRNVSTEFLIAGVVFLVSIVGRGLVLAFYSSNCTYLLLEKLMKKLITLRRKDLQELYRGNSLLNLEDFLESIDTSFSMNFEVGLTFYFESYLILILTTIVSPVFLVIMVPLIACKNITFRIYFGLTHWLINFDIMNERKLHHFLVNIIEYGQQIRFFKKYREFQKTFLKLNKQNILYECNYEWVFSGCRQMIGTLVTIFTILIIMIMILDQSIDPAFVGIAISILLGLTNTLKFQFKVIQEVDKQIIHVTQMFDIVRPKPGQQFEKQNEKEIQIERLSKITFDNFKIAKYNFFGSVDGINLEINKGERLVVTGEKIVRNSRIIYSLFNVYDRYETRGNIRIVGTPERKEGALVAQQNQFNLIDCNIPAARILRMNPKVPSHETVHQFLMIFNPSITAERVDQQLNQLWFQTLEIKNPLFWSDSYLEKLSPAGKQILYYLSVIFMPEEKPCQILVINDGFDSLDMRSRVKMITKLIASEIPVIIQVTKRPQLIKLFTRNIHIEKDRIVSDSRINA